MAHHFCYLGSSFGSDQLFQAFLQLKGLTPQSKRETFLYGKILEDGLVSHLAVDRRSLTWFLESV